MSFNVHRLLDSFNNAINITKLHIHVVNALACLERNVVQTTPIKEVMEISNPTNDAPHAEVYAAHEGVIPSIEHAHFEIEAPVSSTWIAINFVKT